MFTTCMSNWGLFWIFVLFMLPIIVIGLALYTVPLVIYTVAILPFHMLIRYCRGEYPVPPNFHRLFCSCSAGSSPGIEFDFGAMEAGTYQYQTEDQSQQVDTNMPVYVQDADGYP